MDSMHSENKNQQIKWQSGWVSKHLGSSSEAIDSAGADADLEIKAWLFNHLVGGFMDLQPPHLQSHKTQGHFKR